MDFKLAIRKNNVEYPKGGMNMYLRYTKYKNTNKWVHPEWAMYASQCVWKVADPMSNDLVIKTTNEKAHLSTAFVPVEITLSAAKQLVEKYTYGKETLDAEGNKVQAEQAPVVHIWNDCIEFEREFTLEELNKINNYEYFIDADDTISPANKAIYKMYMNTIISSYNKQIAAGKKFFNSDTKLIEMIILLSDIGFVTQARVNEILHKQVI